jgi:hypothetical protein
MVGTEVCTCCFGMLKRVLYWVASEKVGIWDGDSAFGIG